MPNRATILVAEDDEDDVLLLRTAFAEAGLGIPLQVVPDGEDAIAYLKGEGKFADRKEFPLPALVLLDLNMPRKNGLEVLSWVRQQGILKRLPVVILSSSSQGPHINKAYELGANSYLVKLSNFTEFVQRIKLLYSYWLGCAERPELRAEADPLQPFPPINGQSNN
jgi:CheY-like chemotaxis protein